MISRRGPQLDLGGFDPRFLGVSLRFGSPEEWGRFCTETYAFTAPELAAMPADEAFTFMAETTVVQHELRHFHDFLLCPYGQMLFRWKLQACFNGFQALVLLLRAARREGANCLPIPLARWCRMPEERRRAQIVQWDRGPKTPHGGWRPPNIPLLPDNIEDLLPFRFALEKGPDSLSRSLAATARAYDKIGEMVRNPTTAKAPMPLQPWHVMEVSALLVQMQEIANTFGAAAAHRFLNKLPDSGFPVSAVRMFSALDKPWADRKLVPGAADQAAVVAWALMGNYEMDGWKACPTERIGRLFDHMSRQGPPPQGQPLRQTFREWSDATGLSEPFDAIRRHVNSNRALVARYQSIASTRGALAADHNTRVLEASQTLHAATSMMLKAFEDDPEGYVFPDRYLGKLDNYPRPLIRCEFDVLFLSASKLSPKVRKNWIVVFAKEDTQGRRFMRTGVLRTGIPGKEVVKPTAGIKLYTDVLAIDYAFQPTNRLDWEFDQVVRDELWTNLGLRPLNITGPQNTMGS
jgi:hypothetical protein